MSLQSEAEASQGAPSSPQTFALLSAALVTRAELAAVEFAAAKQRTVLWVVATVASAVLLLAALGTLSLLIAAIFWDSYRWQALGALVTAYAAGGALLLAWLRRDINDGPALFAATLSTLRADWRALRRGRGHDE